MVPYSNVPPISCLWLFCSSVGVQSYINTTGTQRKLQNKLATSVIFQYHFTRYLTGTDKKRGTYFVCDMSDL